MEINSFSKNRRRERTVKSTHNIVSEPGIRDVLAYVNDTRIGKVNDKSLKGLEDTPSTRHSKYVKWH
jgi:hypothetical protein